MVFASPSPIFRQHLPSGSPGSDTTRPAGSIGGLGSIGVWHPPLGPRIACCSTPELMQRPVLQQPALQQPLPTERTMTRLQAQQRPSPCPRGRAPSVSGPADNRGSGRVSVMWQTHSGLADAQRPGQVCGTGEGGAARQMRRASAEVAGHGQMRGGGGAWEQHTPAVEPSCFGIERCRGGRGACLLAQTCLCAFCAVVQQQCRAHGAPSAAALFSAA